MDKLTKDEPRHRYFGDIEVTFIQDKPERIRYPECPEGRPTTNREYFHLLKIELERELEEFEERLDEIVHNKEDKILVSTSSSLDKFKFSIKPSYDDFFSEDDLEDAAWEKMLWGFNRLFNWNPEPSPWYTFNKTLSSFKTFVLFLKKIFPKSGRRKPRSPTINWNEMESSSIEFLSV